MPHVPATYMFCYILKVPDSEKLVGIPPRDVMTAIQKQLKLLHKFCDSPPLGAINQSDKN